MKPQFTILYRKGHLSKYLILITVCIEVDREEGKIEGRSDTTKA